MSQNWTALLSLIVVLHITPKRHKWRYSHTKAPPPVLERRNEESPKLFIRYLKENWNIIHNFNQFENQFLNSQSTILKSVILYFEFILLHQFQSLLKWMYLSRFTDNSSSFYFLSFIYTQISKRFSKSQIVSIPNCQNYKLTK